MATKQRLSPASKRVRQKIMHRLTRGSWWAIPDTEVPTTGYTTDEWEAMKPYVHAAVTSVLLEEQTDGS